MAITVSEEIKVLSDLLASRGPKEAACYPIDRYFLEPYIDDILRLDRNSFLFYNLERVNQNYTTQLLLCLPELWQNITAEDLIEIVNQFTNVFSLYTLILFTYKYIEVNTIELIFSFGKIDREIKTEILRYLRSQYNNFFKANG